VSSCKNPPTNTCSNMAGDQEAAIRELGSRLRARRNELGWTIEELAAKAQVSPGQMERGIGNPAFMTLVRIAYPMDLNLSKLFEGPDSTSQVVRKSQRKRLQIPDPGVTFELLTPDSHRDLEMVWVEYGPGVTTSEQPFQHKGQECGLILQGKLEVHIGDETYLLEAGDSIWMDCTIPHWYLNPGQERCICVWAITPPSF